jgi:cytochrome c553
MMPVPRRILVPFLLLGMGLLPACGGDAGQDASPASTTAPEAAVEVPEKISICAECHRKAGRSGPYWPRLQGKTRAELVSLLRAYRDEQRTNEKMNKVAHELSDADIDELADFYSRRI